MTVSTFFCEIAGVNPSYLSKEENQLLEADLFTYICRELMAELTEEYKNYFHILKYSQKKERQFMETSFVRQLIKDILSTEEYSLKGLACYTNTPEDVIYDIAAGKLTDPSASTLRKIIEIHRTIRPSLYQLIMQKLIDNSNFKRDEMHC